MVETGLPGCVVIEPQVFGDDRGFFYESFNADKLAPLGLALHWKQGNVSSSTQGVLRGLHYQWPRPQGKLVSVVQGEVWDVAVDIRRGSPTFGRFEAVELSEDNRKQFFIPEGFAHGFRVLTDVADFCYKCTDFYARGDEYGVHWNDPALGIPWGDIDSPVVSAKDVKLPKLADVPPEQLPEYKG